MDDNVRLIDANALHKEITSFDHSVIYKDWVQSAIASAPTISDVAPVVHGKWINVCSREVYIPAEKTTISLVEEECSYCNQVTKFQGVKPYMYDFVCPCCGAKMDLEE